MTSSSDTDRERSWLLHEKYSGKECPDFFIDLKRLKFGEPLAYVIGWVEFLTCKIDLSLRPLIPRPETEWWVGAVINRRKSGEEMRVLDLFSGSGCIGIAFAKKFPDVVVDCADNDLTALEQIRINVKNNGVANTVRVIQSDVFANISDRYDLICANPPYIDAAERTTVDTSVLDWEPHVALFAHDDGLFYMKKLISEARAHLKPSGRLYAEFGKGQEEKISGLLKQHGWSYVIHNDQYGIPRWFESWLA